MTDFTLNELALIKLAVDSAILEARAAGCVLEEERYRSILRKVNDALFNASYAR